MVHEPKHAAILPTEQTDASDSLSEAGPESAAPQPARSVPSPAMPCSDEPRDARTRRRKGLKAQIRAALPFATGDSRWADYGQHDAELFYLQKQIQQQTPMIVVLEDGRQLQGIIEWYDRSSIKLRGRQRVLIYKSAIKYIYKQGENSGTTMQ